MENTPMEAHSCRKVCAGLLNLVTIVRMHTRPRTAKERIVSYIFIISPVPFNEWCQLVRKHSLMNLLSFRPRCTFVLDACSRHVLSCSYMFSQLWYTMPCNSSPLVAKQVQNGSPSRSDRRYLNLHCSWVPCVAVCYRGLGRFLVSD